MTNRYTSVQDAIRASLNVDQQLPLPSHMCGSGNRGIPFTVTALDYRNLRLSVGSKRNPMMFTWDELEDVVPFMKKWGGEVVIGSLMDTSYTIDTLDGYFKENKTVMRSTYGASILHAAGVAEILCKKPMSIRLRPRWR